jgi:hypothetical protein
VWFGYSLPPISELDIAEYDIKLVTDCDQLIYFC